MKLAVFGAGSLVGLQLVRQALAAGHTVIAIVRGSERHLLPTPPGGSGPDRFTVVVSDHLSIRTDLSGVDAVFCTIVVKQATERRRNLGLDPVVQSMVDSGVRRLVVLAGEGILQATDDKLIMHLPGFSPKFHLAAAEHNSAYMLLQQLDGFEWTMVCPPPLLPSSRPPDQSEYSVEVDHLPDWKPGDSGTVIALAGDVAQFMLAECTARQYLSKRVGIISKVRPGA